MSLRAVISVLVDLKSHCTQLQSKQLLVVRPCSGKGSGVHLTESLLSEKQETDLGYVTA